MSVLMSGVASGPLLRYVNSHLDTHRPLVLLHGRDQHTLAPGSENIRKYRLSRVIAAESIDSST